MAQSQFTCARAQAGVFNPALSLEQALDQLCKHTSALHQPTEIALRIKGDSMAPEFREGDVIIVDPAIVPSPGDFVVGRNGSHEATFKKFRPRGIDASGREVFELVPLNDDYPTMRSDTERLLIVGTMVEHRRLRRR
jgi:SOS-response transcriptional repressor LexA